MQCVNMLFGANNTHPDLIISVEANLKQIGQSLFVKKLKGLSRLKKTWLFSSRDSAMPVQGFASDIALK